MHMAIIAGSCLLQDYVYRFEPLVLEECGALMLRGNEEGIQSEPFQAVCASHKLVSPEQPMVQRVIVLHAVCWTVDSHAIFQARAISCPHCGAQQHCAGCSTTRSDHIYTITRQSASCRRVTSCWHGWLYLLPLLRPSGTMTLSCSPNMTPM